MTDHSQHQYAPSMAPAKSRLETSAASGLRAASSNLSVAEDDRYPGSFFRVPGVPTPGKTTWSLAK